MPIYFAIEYNTIGSIACTAIPRSELPAGSQATVDEYYQLCETESSHIWWPCDVLDPPICRCDGEMGARYHRRLGAPV